MIDGFRVYKFYLAVKLHFTTDKFNVFENQGRVKGSREKYWSRNDRGLFEKLGKEFDTDRDIVEYFVANFIAGNDAAVYDGDSSRDNYRDWLRIKQSLVQNFRSDLQKILLYLEKDPVKMNTLYDFDGTVVPELMKLYIGDEITAQTLVILDKFRSFLPNWKLQTNLIFEDECRRIIKSVGFISPDSFQMKNLEKAFKEFDEELDVINSEREEVNITDSLHDNVNIR